MDVKETLEVLDAGISVAKKLKEVMADGEMSWVDGVKLAITEAPSLMKAVSGIQAVPSELKDLDRAEIELIAEKGIELVKALSELLPKAS